MGDGGLLWAFCPLLYVTCSDGPYFCGVICGKAIAVSEDTRERPEKVEIGNTQSALA